jgi:hypothetical protein
MLDETILVARDVPCSHIPFENRVLILTARHNSGLIASNAFPIASSPNMLRLYPLPTALAICSSSGWGSFQVTYEGCCVTNIGGMFRVDKDADGAAHGCVVGVGLWVSEGRQGKRLLG